MDVTRFLASQLRRPSGLFGRLVTARLLNRSNAPINQATLARLALEPDDRVLEVGFGGGDLLARILAAVADGRVTGADFSDEMVAAARRRFARETRAGKLDLACSDVAALPFDPASFTKACTVNTVYFWPDPAAGFAELARVLRPGGRLVVSFSPRETMERIPVTKHGFTLYESEDVRRLMQDAGFGDVEILPDDGPRGEFVCAVGTRRA